jgi:caffeoyl-CoA O-methyltransferase
MAKAWQKSRLPAEKKRKTAARSAYKRLTVTLISNRSYVMRKPMLLVVIACLFLFAGWSKSPSELQSTAASGDLDVQVHKFLDSHRRTWHDMNVPEADGQKLHDIILEHKYKSALEIGTSTGHSGVWIAWALAKTGGKLVTLEIDKDRHDQALVNFRAAGVAQYIDARLGDAHDLVPALKGPFDFVFCDADKDWYNNYFEAVLPKLAVGGCFAAHNISERGYEAGYSRRFLQLTKSYSYLETTVFTGGAGMSVTYKKVAK